MITCENPLEHKKLNQNIDTFFIMTESSSALLILIFITITTLWQNHGY